MPELTVVATCDDRQSSTELIESLAASAVARLVLVGSNPEASARLSSLAQSKACFIQNAFFSGEAVSQVLKELTTDYALFCLPGESIQLGHRVLERMLSTIENSGAGLVYSDFR